MSQDIVDRLVEPQNVDIGYYWNLADEAADEITKLRQQRDELVLLLKMFVEDGSEIYKCMPDEISWAAAKELEEVKAALAKIEGEK